MACLEVELKFLNHVKCNEHQKILAVDVTSLYPTVNALDPYADG